MDRKPQPNDTLRNLALAAVAGQAGCSTVVIVFLALFGGLLIDSRLHTRPAFTLGLVLLSIPVSLYIMVRMVLSTISQITPPAAPRETDPFTQKEKRL
jgi:hypothetical protein